MVIYCISRTDPNPGAAAATAAGILITIAVHAWRRNAALSIVAGTAACMLVDTLTP